MTHLEESASVVERRSRTLTARGALGFIVLLGVVSLFADMTYEGGRRLVGQYLCLLGAGAAAIAAAAFSVCRSGCSPASPCRIT